MKKKPKKRIHAAKACRYIQLYVKLLETDKNGYGQCVSCGKMCSWTELQGGHFQPKGRNYNAAAFEEDNIHIQDTICNLTLGGNPAGYSAYMLKEYGQAVIDEIRALSYKYLDCNEIDGIARIYKQKCIDLAKTKNFKVNIP